MEFRHELRDHCGSGGESLAVEVPDLRERPGQARVASAAEGFQVALVVHGVVAAFLVIDVKAVADHIRVVVFAQARGLAAGVVETLREQV